jgi:hypothetical protein
VKAVAGFVGFVASAGVDAADHELAGVDLRETSRAETSTLLSCVGRRSSEAGARNESSLPSEQGSPL